MKKMQMMVRKRYLRFLLPALAGLLVLALLLLLVSGFGFRYLLRKPVPLSSLKADELPGSYVTVPVEDLKDGYALYGYQDDTGATVVNERFCIYPVEGKYLIVRITKDFVPLLEKLDSANDLIASGEVGSILELNFGDIRGTVNKADKDAVKQLRGWITAHQIDAQTMTDRYMNADISGYEGAADGDYTAYLEAVILPLQLESGYMGNHTAAAVKALSLISLLLILLAVLLVVSIFLGFWEKPYRAAIRQYGRPPMSADFGGAALFGPALRIGERFIWVSGVMTTRVLAVKDVIWAYPRSRRLEGGKQTWLLVMKTNDGKEASVKLGAESTVEHAIACIASRGWPLVVGFDKEKQKLYKKDLAAFQARARNGTLR